MIVDRITEYLDKGSDHEVDEQALGVALRGMKRGIVRNLGPRNDGGRSRNPSPSSSWACGRRLLFDWLGLDREDVSWRARLTFMHGDVNEAAGILLARQAGVDLLTPDPETGEQLTVEAMVNPADWGVDGEPFPLVGHVDATLEVHSHGECPADWKAVSTYTFQDMEQAAKRKDAPWWAKERDGYVAQVRWYCIALRLMGRGDGQWGCLVGVNKNTGHLCEVVVPYDHEEEVRLIRKAAYVWAKIREAQALDNLGEDEAMAKWVRDSIPRPRWAADPVPCTGKLPGGLKGKGLKIPTQYDEAVHGPKAEYQQWRCGYCPFTTTCWPGFSLVPLSKPEYRKAVK